MLAFPIHLALLIRAFVERQIGCLCIALAAGTASQGAACSLASLIG